jgi:hypothetical protein
MAGAAATARAAITADRRKEEWRKEDSRLIWIVSSLAQAL